MPRVAVLGSAPLLGACMPASIPGALDVVEAPREPTAESLAALAPDAVVAFEPGASELDLLGETALPALLWRSEYAPPAPAQRTVLAEGDHPDAWRCVGLPVADGLYADPEPGAPARAAWLGAATPRREAYLSWFEHAQPPDAGDGGDALVAVNLHDDERPAFEHRAACALAAGRLLVSETLSPARGVEPGIDYLEARDLDDLFLAVESAVHEPAAYRRVRLRGRRKAELFRASRVVERLVGDLLLELQWRRP